jgi:DNA modification methylase
LQITTITEPIYAVGLGGTTSDRVAFKHPATFPEKLAQDHVLSWSNEGDLVFDPMCGSGTTCKMAFLSKRKYLGVDISEEYINIAKTRLLAAQKKQSIKWRFDPDVNTLDNNCGFKTEVLEPQL